MLKSILRFLPKGMAHEPVRVVVLNPMRSVQRVAESLRELELLRKDMERYIAFFESGEAGAAIWSATTNGSHRHEVPCSLAWWRSEHLRGVFTKAVGSGYRVEYDAGRLPSFTQAARPSNAALTIYVRDTTCTDI